MSDTMKELARPFPSSYVHKNPSGGGDYIKHHVINQRLIQVLGVPPHFTLVEVIRGGVAAIPPNPNGKSKRATEGRPALDNVVVAVIARMQVEIDGETVIVDEAGDCESPHNWDTDGQRLKDAMSDAYKRCAMRLGVGLHLWSQDEYFLFTKLSEGGEVSASARPSQPSTTQTGGDAGADVSGTGTDNEGARNRDDKVDDGAVGSSKPAPVSDVVPGSAPRDAEPGGDEATAADSPPPATDLVEVYGKSKVLQTARQLAVETAVEQPRKWEDITRALCVLVAQALEKEKQPA